MKLVMVANIQNSNRYKAEKIVTLMEANIDNSLELGWSPSDIIFLSNIDFEFMGIKTTRIQLNQACLTGSKMFGLKYLYDTGMVNETIWMKDLDAWQSVWFNEPEFADVGGAYYSRPKFNGGSIFWKPQAEDICNEVVEQLSKFEDPKDKEEPTLNSVFKSKKYKDRVTVLNNTFNVGCSGYVERYERSIKPIHVAHFHPYNRIAWETHCLDRNGLGVRGLVPRLERLIRKYYPGLATELSAEGVVSQKEKIRKRKEKEDKKDKE